MRLLKLLLVLFFCAAEPAVGGPLDDAFAAYEKGDYPTALRLLHPLADQGDVNAQYGLGDMYERGVGVPRNYVAAVSWYGKAAAQGYAAAQFKLGLLHGLGLGVTQDHVIEQRWYRKAAEQGYVHAQYNLGQMFATGKGVPLDSAEAIYWYRKAADQGFVLAQRNLGSMYARGEGVSRDYATALRWYREAAEQGDADSRYALGVFFERGLSVPQDRDMAVWWYQRAVDQKHEGARKALQALISQAAKTPTNPATAPSPKRSTEASLIQMKKVSGTYVVPVLINDAITLDFVVDSGAADVTVPEDVVSTLVRTETIKKTDFIGEQTYVLADGSRVKSKTFRIRSLKVGDRILENVTGTVADRNGSLLLGQRFLGRFKSWSIDNTKHVLALE